MVTKTLLPSNLCDSSDSSDSSDGCDSSDSTDYSYSSHISDSSNRKPFILYLNQHLIYRYPRFLRNQLKKAYLDDFKSAISFIF